ncbi:MAG: M20/M25/M40 family metallo-hydrolase [Gemmatimonadaceae bacterium]
MHRSTIGPMILLFRGKLTTTVLGMSVVVIASVTATNVVEAQSSSASPDAAAVASWLAFDAPPGEERNITATIMKTDSRWRRDAIGNVIMTVGTGHPRRLVACGLDHVGYVVSEITESGYLRLHRAGNARAHPLWDQFHEAQQINVLTQGGDIPGVVAVSNVHFNRMHLGDTTVVNVNELWVDIGAHSRQEALHIGVRLLDPVARRVKPWQYGDYVAGADASGRAGCAAVASVAHSVQATQSSGQTVFVLSVQKSFGWRGLQAAVAELGSFDEGTVVTSSEQEKEHGSGTAVTTAPLPRAANLFPDAGLSRAMQLEVRARFDGSLVESVESADLDALMGAVRKAAGVDQSTAWVSLAARNTSRRAVNDGFSAAASLLTTLAELPGVYQFEQPVRDAVRAALPGWARSAVTQDSTGNLILAMGPDRDTTVFLAHMDEVGYTVRSIASDGMVTLDAAGGVMRSSWEGQPAQLYLDNASEHGGVVSPSAIDGVFVPRDDAKRKQPDDMHAWFGMDSTALVARGVHAGSPVIGYKRGVRLAATRYTARSLDDRTGVTALLLALRDIQPATLRHKVIFIWTVGEETGLHGATAAALRIGRSVHEAYAIDTFVSSDTPLESPLFAYAPLGSGAVLRAMDDGLVVSPSERTRIMQVAHSNGIPLQVGVTRGSTDAVPFVARGALGAGLSWPGRYSHSPAEVLDLNDLNTLARLIVALTR